MYMLLLKWAVETLYIQNHYFSGDGKNYVFLHFVVDIVAI